MEIIETASYFPLGVAISLLAVFGVRLGGLLLAPACEKIGLEIADLVVSLCRLLEPFKLFTKIVVIACDKFYHWIEKCFKRRKK